MSQTITKTIEVVPDRTARIVIDKPYNGTASIMTVDETIIDGVHSTTGNMSATFDSANPLHVALYSALEAVVLEMRTKRDELQ